MKILKTIVAGILVGTAIFLMPFFLLKLFAIIVLLKLSFRLLGCGRRGRFAHHFKNMTEEEKSAFLKSCGNACGHRHSQKTQATV